MTTTLSEGVKVPDVGSVNWAGDLEVNWNLLNGALANLSGNVKTDRDNTWTGEQSFTLPIVGSITGTAAKAIADEDGTNIKTGYVNVAGNQTVTGNKSFTGSNAFNNILPNATNTYSLGSSSYQWSSVYAQSYYYNGTQWGLDQNNTWTGNNNFTSDFVLQNTSWSGVTPPSSAKPVIIEFKNSNTRQGRYINRISSTSSETWIETIRNIDANTSYNFTLVSKIDNSGVKSLYPYTAGGTGADLGISTNQWSSVYAQTYYYNGVAWGLDKANVWTGNNTFSSVIKQSINSIYSQTPASDRFAVHEFNGTDNNRIFTLNCADRSSGQREISLIVYDTDGTFKASGIFKESDGTFSFRARSNNEINLGTSTNQWKSVYAQTYYYNGTAWGLNKANTWTNTQTYSSDSYGQMIWLKNTGLDLSVNGNTGLSSSYQHMIHWCDKNNAIYSSIQSWTASSENTLVLRSYYRTDANTIRNLSVRFTSTATNKVIYPETNADTELGTSTKKWKTLNGINPGALSLPDLVNLIDVSGSIVPPSGESTINYSGGQNTFMPSVDGWLSIRLDGASFLQIYRNAYNCPGTTVSEPSGTRKLVTTLPVKAGVTYIIVMVGNPTETRFHLYPCLGNV